VGPQDLRTGRRLLEPTSLAARRQSGMISHRAGKIFLANFIVNPKNYYDSSANALDNLENLAYSREGGLIAGLTALDLDRPAGLPPMAEGPGAYGGDVRGMGRGAGWSGLVGDPCRA
jgi:hypothetical protein